MGQLYAIGGALIFVEIVAVIRLVKRFSGEGASEHKTDKPAEDDEELVSTGKLVFLGFLGLITSVVGGHAVGDFAGILVSGLKSAGYSEMFGALILSIFAAAGAYVMIGMAHSKGMYDVALASASGAVSQVPFVVMPVALIQIAIFYQMGIIPETITINEKTTAVIFLAFPPLLLLWKAVQDDGKVNWVETAAMVAIFGLTLYFLAT